MLDDGESITVEAMIYPRRQVPLRTRIPTVLVRLSTDDGDVVFRARWKHRPIELQRRIMFLLRQGKPVWFEDEWGHGLCFKAERVWGAVVDGRKSAGRGAPSH